MPRQFTGRWSDINGIFGLLVDNIAVMALFFGLIANLTLPNYFAGSFVIGRMIPGLVVGVVAAGFGYAVLAIRLARRTGRLDVTAMPMGLDTPSVFVMALVVLLPTLKEAHEKGMDPHSAAVFAWNVGMAVTIVLGVFKTVMAPFANLLRQWIPRTAWLASLAAVALAIIAFLPLAQYIAAVPVVGLPTLAVVFILFLVGPGVVGRMPGAILALVAGVVIFQAVFMLGNWLDRPMLPLGRVALLLQDEYLPLPQGMWTSDWWTAVWAAAWLKLPDVLPLGLATILGGIECTESAAAAGDEYDARSVLMTQGVATLAAGLCGGVVQVTPYFGHPAYKRMQSRVLYVVATALLVALAGYSGMFVRAAEWLPPSVLYPVIVYVGLYTIAHALESLPRHEYAALALAAIPVLAYVTLIPLDAALGARPPHANGAVLTLTLRCLANGFVVTSLLWAAALSALLNGHAKQAATFLFVCAVCSLFGIIHSPLRGATIAWPQYVVDQLPGDIEFQCQTPPYWAAAYCIAAVFTLISGLFLRAANREPSV